MPGTLGYKIEFIKDDRFPNDPSLFIHLRDNVPFYQDRIDKEDYDLFPEEAKDDFISGLFGISGIEEVSSKAFRVWFAYSLAFSVDEVLNPALFHIAFSLDKDELDELPGSGITLDSFNDRRDI